VLSGGKEDDDPSTRSLTVAKDGEYDDRKKWEYEDDEREDYQVDSSEV